MLAETMHWLDSKHDVLKENAASTGLAAPGVVDVQLPYSTQTFESQDTAPKIRLVYRNRRISH